MSNKEKKYTARKSIKKHRDKTKKEKIDLRIRRTIFKLVRNISIVLLIQVLLVVLFAVFYENPECLDSEKLNTAEISIEEVVKQDVFLPVKRVNGTRYLIKSGNDSYQISMTLVDRKIPRRDICDLLEKEKVVTVVYEKKNSLFRGEYNYVHGLCSQDTTYYTIEDSLKRTKANNISIFIAGLIIEFLFVGVVGIYAMYYFKGTEFALLKKDIKKR